VNIYVTFPLGGKFIFAQNKTQLLGGILKKNILLPDGEDFPPWLDMCVKKIAEESDAFPPENYPNHVLLNEYLPGQGIMVLTYLWWSTNRIIRLATYVPRFFLKIFSLIWTEMPTFLL